jgi:hypothetical protein
MGIGSRKKNPKDVDRSSGTMTANSEKEKKAVNVINMAFSAALREPADSITLQRVCDEGGIQDDFYKYYKDIFGL